MTVEARTAKAAARIAAASGGVHPPAQAPGKLSRRVRLTGDFEAHRAAVEAVTVWFGLCTDDGAPAPSGWTVTGASFEVQWPKESPPVATVLPGWVSPAGLTPQRPCHCGRTSRRGRSQDAPLGVAEMPRARVVPYVVPVLEVRLMTVTASDARKRLFPLIEQVNNDRQPVEITSKRGDAVLLSRADFDALQETAWLLRVPANARWLLESLAQARDGERFEHERE